MFKCLPQQVSGFKAITHYALFVRSLVFSCFISCLLFKEYFPCYLLKLYKLTKTRKHENTKLRPKSAQCVITLREAFKILLYNVGFQEPNLTHNTHCNKVCCIEALVIYLHHDLQSSLGKIKAISCVVWSHSTKYKKLFLHGLVQLSCTANQYYFS